VMQHIYEANAGVKLSGKRDLWLDAGIFSSHIGFESAVGRDNWTLTRSLVAENSPYYLAGAKLTYNTPNGKWTVLGAVVNGWQRIKRLDGLSTPGLSTQLQFRPTGSLTVNWSTYFGSDRPDSLRQRRMYHNLYTQFQQGKAGLILGFDIGSDRKPVINGKRTGEGAYTWLTPVAILRYRFSDKFRMAGRAEYFQDKHEVVITTGTGGGFETTGYSLNADYAITPQALWRIEVRQFHGKGTYFNDKAGTPSRLNTAITTSLSIQF
ncbi:outer membrane beta-barrel protein, partial [Arsenicibacter rosenii]